LLLCPMPPSLSCICFCSYDTATTHIYTLSLHDALPICFSLPFSALNNPVTHIITTKIQPTRNAIHPKKGITFKKLNAIPVNIIRSEEHTSELQSRENLVCRLLLEKKKARQPRHPSRTAT